MLILHGLILMINHGKASDYQGLTPRIVCKKCVQRLVFHKNRPFKNLLKEIADVNMIEKTQILRIHLILLLVLAACVNHYANGKGV